MAGLAFAEEMASADAPVATGAISGQPIFCAGCLSDLTEEWGKKVNTTWPPFEFELVRKVVRAGEPGTVAMPQEPDICAPLEAVERASSLSWSRLPCSSCHGVVLILGTKKTPKGGAICFRCIQERRAAAEGRSTSAANATAPRPILTGAHLCLHCRHPIRQRGQEGFGVAHRTFHHDECLRLTDVYASVYYCPCCVRQPTLLESPKAQWGKSTTCLTCATTFVVPSDAPFREVDPLRVEGRHFSFLCPSCAGALECNVKHAGALAVCLHCRFAITVPNFGEAAPPEPRRAHPRSPGEAIRPVGSGRCPNCGAAVPRGSARCPVCEGEIE
jgi:hypothetical protein